MAIRWNAETMAGRERHAVEVAAGKSCYWGSAAEPGCAVCRGARTAVEHEGSVLVVGLPGGSFNDGYDHSIDALVWDAAKGETRRISIGSTMGISATAEVDATPEVRAAAEAYEAALEAAACRRRELLDARVPRKGRTVRVVRGRKVPKGTEGVVFWYGESRFGPRIGIKDAAGNVHWTAAGNVETLTWLAAIAEPEAA